MTTTALVPATNLAEIEALDPASREVAVTGMLAEARSWLAHAVETTAPRQMADFKAFVATIAETTRQLNLSREIQLDAQEMVRRAERGVGLAIRKGQVDKTVQTRVDGGWRSAARHLEVPLEDLKTPVRAIATKRELSGGNSNGIYALTDDVTDERFDEALTEAKDEGNLSRANVVRKVRGEAPKPSGRPEHLRGMRHFDAHRAISESVYAVDGVRSVLDRLEPHHLDDLDPGEVSAWVDSLTESIRSLNRLQRQLKELTQA